MIHALVRQQFMLIIGKFDCNRFPRRMHVEQHTVIPDIPLLCAATVLQDESTPSGGHSQISLLNPERPLVMATRCGASHES